MSVKYSQELLTHFLCNVCELWWTIADWKIELTTQITCPHCGSIHALFEKAQPLSKEEQ